MNKRFYEDSFMEEELKASTMNDQMIIEPGLVGFREENMGGGDYHDILSEIKEEGLYASDGDSYFLAAEMIERMMKVPPQPEQSNQEQSERIGDSEEEIGDNGSLNITYYSILDEDDEMNPSVENGFEEEEEKNEEEGIRGSNWTDIPSGWTQQWLPEYNLMSGPSDRLPENIQSTSDYFRLFFDQEVLTLLVSETNRYASQYYQENPSCMNSALYREWKDVTMEKMFLYINLLIHMGLTKFPKVSYHWSKNELYTCKLCPALMKRNEFILINKFFHVANNQNANLNDKIYKIRPLLNLFLNKWQRYFVLDKRISIDERMIKFRGRIGFLQFIRSKPTKWGFKAFILADCQTGYTYAMKIYTGSNGTRNQNLAHNVVLELLEGLGNKGHHLYFDSYYCSIPTVEYLSTKGFGCVGTIQKNRKALPKDIKNPPGTLQRGETLFKKKGNIICCVYKDKRDVRFLSSLHNNEIAEDNKPIVLKDYNKWMRGVDKSNQYLSYYNSEHKSVKWWKPIFNSLLETCLTNSYILYKCKHPNSSITQLNFREKLLMETSQEFFANKRDEEVPRIVPGLHQIGKRKQKNCFVCSTENTRVTSSFYCIECDKNVCIVSCFYIMHTRLEIQAKRKENNLL